MNHLSHFYNTKVIELLNGCLNTSESERYDIKQVVTDLWFKTYYKRYAEKIAEQSQAQMEKNKKDKRKMDKNIPYYKPQK